jgi:hypothetical protein
MVEPVTVPCQECGVELDSDSPELLTCDDEPLVYCLECWASEFDDGPDLYGGSAAAPGQSPNECGKMARDGR